MCAAATTSGGGGDAANACVFQKGEDKLGMKSKTNHLAAIGCCGPARKSACGVAPAEPAQGGKTEDKTENKDTPCSKTDGTVVPWEAASTFIYAECKCGKKSCSQGSTCNVAKNECGCTPR